MLELSFKNGAYLPFLSISSIRNTNVCLIRKAKAIGLHTRFTHRVSNKEVGRQDRVGAQYGTKEEKLKHLFLSSRNRGQLGDQILSKVYSC